MANRFQRTIRDGAGNVAAAVAVTVTDPVSGDPVTIYSDEALTSVKANPGVTDANGRFDFWAADTVNLVDVTAGEGVSAYTLQDVLIGVPQSQPYASRAAAVAANIPATVTRILVAAPSGDTLAYVRDVSGTALTTADGGNWSPDGTDTPGHYTTLGVTTAENRAAIAAAVSSGHAEIDATMDITGSIVVDGDIILDGRGQTLTRDTATQEPIGAVRWPLFAPSGRLDLKDITLSAPPVNAARIVLFGNASGAESVRAERVTVDFGNYLDEDDNIIGIGNCIAAFQDGFGEIDGIDFWFSKFTRGVWGLLKSNTAVSTERNIRVVGNDFDDWIGPYLLFNSPATGSLIDGALVAFNNMGSVLSPQPFIGGVESYPHRGSFAGHVEYTRLIGNHAYGYGGEFFRAEEAAKASVWLGNTAKLDGKDGIEIIAAAAGGTVNTPTLFAVADNVLENVGLNSAPGLGWGIGLHTYTSSPGLADAECIGESTVHDNISKGWEQGLQVHQGAQRNLIHHNVIADSAQGIKTWAPSLGMHDNLISDCPVAVYAERGGLIGKFHLRSSDAVPLPFAVTVIEGPLATEGWTWETGRHSVANGSVYYRIIDIGNRIDAEVTVSVSDDTGANYCIEKGHILYDGTTMVYTRSSRYAAGNVGLSVTTPFGIDTSDFAIHVSNVSGGIVTNMRIQVALDGLQIWGA